VFSHNSRIFTTQRPLPKDVEYLPPFITPMNRYSTGVLAVEEEIADAPEPVRMYLDTPHPASRQYRFDDVYGENGWETGAADSIKGEWNDRIIEPLLKSGRPVEVIAIDHPRFAKNKSRRNESEFLSVLVDAVIAPLVAAFPTAYVAMYGADIGPAPSRTMAWDATSEPDDGSDPFPSHIAEIRRWSAWIRGYGQPDGRGVFPRDNDADFKQSIDSVFDLKVYERPGACMIWTPPQMTSHHWAQMIVSLCVRFGWPLSPIVVAQSRSAIVTDIMNRFDRDGSLQPGDTTMFDILHALKHT